MAHFFAVFADCRNALALGAPFSPGFRDQLDPNEFFLAGIT
jgi:hypothetical protein